LSKAGSAAILAAIICRQDASAPMARARHRPDPEEHKHRRTRPNPARRPCRQHRI